MKKEQWIIAIIIILAIIGYFAFVKDVALLSSFESDVNSEEIDFGIKPPPPSQLPNFECNPPCNFPDEVMGFGESNDYELETNDDCSSDSECETLCQPLAEINEDRACDDAGDDIRKNFKCDQPPEGSGFICTRSLEMGNCYITIESEASGDCVGVFDPECVCFATGAHARKDAEFCCSKSATY
ncbi:MAG: hypothetical protein KJ718_04655 [Nanoarchaeota archaeon]|nr:hypothetical protein [Nanoarchaeota archaeon]MBU1051817.1 hypothetical protein [Nanoarchaeota archaeon]MBU1988847.1 hypothetical protein [Nanoarchaeota archaeon]